MRPERLKHLRQMLERYQHGHRGGRRPSVPTGLARLDEALPRGGLPVGAITEIFSPLDGGGAMGLAFQVARAAAVGGRTVVMVDPRGDFYPPAAWQVGIAVERLLVIRTPKIDQALWAIDQALRCSAVAAVVAPIQRIEQAVSRRLQLAAESAGVIGLLLRPGASRRHSFAAVQMLVEPVGWPGSAKQTRVEQVVHGSACGGPMPPPNHEACYGSACSGSLKKCGPGLQPEPTPVENRCHTAWGQTVRDHMAFESTLSRLCRVTLLKVREGMPVEPFIIGLGDETGAESVLPVPGHRPVGLDHRRISA